MNQEDQQYTVDPEHVLDDPEDQPGKNLDEDTVEMTEISLTRGSYKNALIVNGKVIRLINPAESNVPEEIHIALPVVSKSIAATLASGKRGIVVEIKNTEECDDDKCIGIIFDEKDEEFIRWLTPKQFDVVA